MLADLDFLIPTKSFNYFFPKSLNSNCYRSYIQPVNYVKNFHESNFCLQLELAEKPKRKQARKLKATTPAWNKKEPASRGVPHQHL